jgi:hypothetical protein
VVVAITTILIPFSRAADFRPHSSPCALYNLGKNNKPLLDINLVF